MRLILTIYVFLITDSIFAKTKLTYWYTPFRESIETTAIETAKSFEKKHPEIEVVLEKMRDDDTV